MKLNRVFAGFLIIFCMSSISNAAFARTTITLEHELEYPPFLFERDGNVTGFNVDLTNILFEDEKYLVEASTDIWENVYSRIKSGEIDTCGMMGITDQRKKEVLFSKKVRTSYTAIYTADGLEDLTVDSLGEYRVGVGRDQFAEAILRDKVGIKEYTTYTTVNDAIFALDAGEIDALFENQEVVNYLIIQNGLEGKIIQNQSNLFGIDIAYGVRKDYPELIEYINKRMKHLKSAGVYEELYLKYFFRHSDEYIRDRRNNTIALTALILVLVFIAFVIQRLIIKRLRVTISDEDYFTMEIFNSSDMFVWAVREDTTTVKISPTAQEMIGCSANSLKGKILSQIECSSSDFYKIHELMLKAVKSEISSNTEVLFEDGRFKRITYVFEKVEIENIHGKPLIALVGFNITKRVEYEIRLKSSYEELEATYEELTAAEEEVKQQLVDLNTKQELLSTSERKLHHMAYHDALTDLPSRAALDRDLKYHIEKTDEALAVMYIDADNFKLINDTLGHSMGDVFLTKIGRRLSIALDNQGMLYRVGGDEFVILTENIENLKYICKKIMDSFENSFKLCGRIIYSSISMGISIYPNDGLTSDEVLSKSDIAMYKAKDQGRRKFVFYDSYMDEAVKERMEYGRNLRDALINDEFLLHYQPQYDILDNKIIGFEALIRWDNPELGLVPPLKFISIAEESSIIIPVGKWVLKNACIFIKQLHHAGYPDLSISVNVSIYQLLHESFVEEVMEILTDYDLDPGLLELELTESVLIESYESIGNVLNSLRAMGVKIALDDFGKGYSSLSYLRYLPITTIKIDKCFTDGIAVDNKTRILISAIASIGKEIGLNIIVEGVEENEQIDYLRSINCRNIQGYVFSKALPENEAYELLCKT